MMDEAKKVKWKRGIRTEPKGSPEVPSVKFRPARLWVKIQLEKSGLSLWVRELSGGSNRDK